MDEMTIEELRRHLTVSVPVAGRFVGLGRDAAFAAAHRGELPVLRMGRRLLVPVPKLLALLGADAA